MKIDPATLKTGELLKASVHKIPFIYHYGFVIVENGRPMIYHNTPNKTNAKGGNVVVDDLATWTKTRTIVKRETTGISEQRIREVTKKHEKKAFNLFTWNCEHYVFLIKDKVYRSPQLSSFIWYASILILFLGIRGRRLLRSPVNLAFGSLMLISVLSAKPSSLKG